MLKPNKSLYRSLAGARASAKTEPISFDGGMTAFGVIGLPFQTAVELRHGSQLIPTLVRKYLFLKIAKIQASNQ